MTITEENVAKNVLSQILVWVLTYPIAGIWAMNYLFNAEIPYTIKAWAASAIVVQIVRSRGGR